MLAAEARYQGQLERKEAEYAANLASSQQALSSLVNRNRGRAPA